ncbi:esterase, PHB depolymerase family [Anaerovirgula multivorans]|uniref:Esterase, PHB depolymerase family n=1 Tax=Anaerovirgula multivorans TaxID=312168 RepID=A0A239GDS0_9FIRM|nr:PHB depolymerase family esterase [Anaerovirgula multivorans]SNS66623.1 esterase, PHB depolymerase family [Anaerovirgula multivorans]
MFKKQIAKRWFKTPLSVLMVMILLLVGLQTPVFAQTQITTFPELNYMGLTEMLNPQNPYEPMLKGLYQDKVTVNGKERSFVTFIPESVTQGDNSIYIAVPSGVDTAKFLETSGWKNIAQKHKLYLFAFEPENQKWDTSKAVDEIDYIRAVYARVNTRPYYNIIMGNYYFVGYGEGGTLFQQYIMANPKIAAGLAVFDGSDISQSYMEEVGARTSDDPRVPLSKVKVPIWIITENLNDTTQNVINYWLNANDTTEDVYSTEYATVYKQSLVTTRRLDNEQNVSSVQVSVRSSNYNDPKFNEVVWKDFLSKTCRYGTDVYNNALRAYASFEELGVEKVEINVDGYTRHWFQYVPTSVRENPEKEVPLVLALHGSGQTGAIFVSYTEWYKVAEERGFIVVFPTGYPGAFADGTPRPYWNITRDPERPDDVKFIDEMIKAMKNNYAIDDNRVYVTGQSLGSMMTNTLVLTMPEIFAAAAGTSGSLLRISNPDYKFPEGVNIDYEIPVGLIFGEKDLWGGGSLNANSDAKATIVYWIARNNAGSVEEPLTYKSGIFNHQVWNNEDGIPMVRYTITQGRGHNCIAAEMWLLWDEFLSKFSRNENGKIEYMQDADVMR